MTSSVRSIGHSPSTNVGVGHSIGGLVVVVSAAVVVVASSPDDAPSPESELQPAATAASTTAMTNARFTVVPMGGDATGVLSFRLGTPGCGRSIG